MGFTPYVRRQLHRLSKRRLIDEIQSLHDTIESLNRFASMPIKNVTPAESLCVQDIRGFIPTERYAYGRPSDREFGMDGKFRYVVVDRKR